MAYIYNYTSIRQTELQSKTREEGKQQYVKSRTELNPKAKTLIIIIMDISMAHDP